MSIRKPLITIACLSVSIILLEILLTRIFSVTLSHHFAFAAVSVGMMGLAAAGIRVFLGGKRLASKDPDDEISRAIVAFAGSIVFTLIFCVKTDTSLAVSWDMALVICSTYVICLFPFYFGGKAITLLFTYYRESFGKLYAADLIAAGISCFLVSPMLLFLGAPCSVLVIAVLVCALCIFVISPASRNLRRIAYAISFACIALIVLDRFTGVLSPTFPKGNSYEDILYERWNTFSRVAVYNQMTGPWALGPKYKGKVSSGYLLDIDASASTMVTPATHGNSNDYLRYELTAAGYWGASRERGLVIGSGGGRDVVTALLLGMGHVDAVEINPLIVQDVMKGQFAEFSGHLYEDPRVSVHIADGRTFVTRTPYTYDTIQLSLVDTWAATSAGAFALSENNLYTTEAALAYITHLKAGGILSVVRWSGEDIFRLVGILANAAGRADIHDLKTHFMVLEGHKVHISNVLFRSTPFDETTLKSIRDAAQEAGFDIVYDPDHETGHPIDRVLRSSDPVLSISQMSDTDLRPSTDDWPFFFSRMKKNWAAFAFANPRILFMQGEYLVAELFLLSVLLGVAVLVFPLLKSNPGGASRRSPLISQLVTTPYFACIGVGFMLFEVSSMQRYVLYLGHPTHALTTVLSGLLFSTGVGSYIVSTDSFSGGNRLLASVSSLVTALLLFVLNFVQPMVFRATQSFSIEAKILISESMILPVGVLLGTLMPLGMKQITRSQPHLVPWAWGVNGLASVAGSCIAVLLAMRLGFAATLNIGSMTYLAASACVWLLGISPAAGSSLKPHET